MVNFKIFIGYKGKGISQISSPIKMKLLVLLILFVAATRFEVSVAFWSYFLPTISSLVWGQLLLISIYFVIVIINILIVHFLDHFLEHGELTVIDSRMSNSRIKFFVECSMHDFHMKHCFTLD